jgi:putative peptide zinc metalloprotease protein
MNLSEALNAALPELPTRHLRKGYPRLDPAIVAKEHIEEGKAAITIHRPGTSKAYGLTPAQWHLAQMFDGERSYAEVAERYARETGESVSEEELKEFCEALNQIDIWYRTPQEKNIALMEKLTEERRKHSKKKSKYGDVAHMQFSAWDPDAFMTWAYGRCRWVYTRWFTALTLALFAFMTYVFIDRWGEIGRDTLKYYTFTEKTFGDLAEFWLLFLAIGFFHESAHAITCKHYGGGVHRMGFHLIYLTPAFFVDATEVWVYGNRWQRMVTIIAGIWVELIFCALATIVWWGSAPGTWIHEFAYKVVLITGVAVVIVNLNPLIKLDGYYFFSEMFDIQNIKERSTAYVSGLIRKYVWKLPVEVEFVPRRLRYFFVPYCVVSGFYSYMLLLFAVSIVHNINLRFFGDWAFVPTLYVAWLVFRSRIKNLVKFMHTLYLDKKERLRAWMRTPYAYAAGAILLALLLAPIWRENADAHFVLEPAERHVVRALVPGRVEQVLVKEGDVVEAGQPLMRLSSLALEAEAVRGRAGLQEASLRRQQAQTRFANLGEAVQQYRQAEVVKTIAEERLDKLTVRARIEGTVLTPRPEDRVGESVDAGAELMEIGDLRRMNARLYVPEYAMRGLQIGSDVRLYVEAESTVLRGTLPALAPESVVIPEGLIHKAEYRGIHPSSFYSGVIAVENPGQRLRVGMSGRGKILVRRRSAVGLAWQTVADFLGRKFW